MLKLCCKASGLLKCLGWNVTAFVTTCTLGEEPEEQFLAIKISWYSYPLCLFSFNLLIFTSEDCSVLEIDESKKAEGKMLNGKYCTKNSKAVSKHTQWKCFYIYIYTYILLEQTYSSIQPTVQDIPEGI